MFFLNPEKIVYLISCCIHDTRGIRKRDLARTIQKYGYRVGKEVTLKESKKIASNLLKDHRSLANEFLAKITIKDNRVLSNRSSFKVIDDENKILISETEIESLTLSKNNFFRFSNGDSNYVVLEIIYTKNGRFLKYAKVDSQFKLLPEFKILTKKINKTKTIHLILSWTTIKKI